MLPFRAFAIAAALSAASLSALAPAASAATPFPAAPQAVGYDLRGIQVTFLAGARVAIANDGKTFGVDASPGAVSALLIKAGNQPDPIMVDSNALLVNTHGRLVLIDTSVGPKGKSVLVESLAQAGVTPAQITDVLITHTHFDHIGGLLDAEGRSAFPNAVIRFSSKAWDDLKAQPDSKALVDVISPQVKTFEPGEIVAPAIKAVALDGHSPGHVGYEVGFGAPGDRLLDVGDAVHSQVISLSRPDWIMGFDGDRELGRQTRMALLKRLSLNHELVFAPHFPYPAFGWITANGKDSYSWSSPILSNAVATPPKP